MNYISDVLKQYSAQLQKGRDERRAEIIAAGGSLPTQFSNLQPLEGYYGRLFAEGVEVDNFGPMAGTDQYVLNAASTRSFADVARELPRWWETRIEQIFNDLQTIDESTGQTYLEEIFSKVRLGRESLSSVALSILGSFINGYLWSLSEPIIKKETERFEHAYDPRNPTIIPEQPISQIQGRLIEQTFEVVERLLSSFNERVVEDKLAKFEKGLNDPVEQTLLAGEEIAGLGNDELMAPEVEKLLEWCASLDKTDLKKVATGIGDYLYKEDESGKFAIQYLMDQLIGTQGNSDQYMLYQKKCADIVFHFAMNTVRGSTPSNKEKQQRENLLVTEHKKQANISKRELTQIIKVVNNFSRHLGNIRMPRDAEPLSFNQEVSNALHSAYVSNDRRISSSEKNQLANTIVASAKDALNKLPKGAQLSLRQAFSHFISNIKKWVISTFSSRLDANDTASSTTDGSNSTLSSSDSRASGDSSMENKATEIPKNKVIEASEGEVKNLQEGLQKAIAPLPSSSQTPKSRPS